MTFYQFQKLFPDDAACLEHILVTRYGGRRFHCPKCGALSNFYRLQRHPAYICQHCQYNLYPCVGTPMERSHTPLHKWFYAMYLFSTSRNGISAKELQRQIGVTYKTAWRMAHEIRKYMAEVDDEHPLDGDVEADETYIGGKRTLQPIIEKNIKQGSTVHTDELRSYLGLAKAGYRHRTVNHRAGEYSRNDSHVNSLEGFWARLKLSIQGTHVHVSPKHLWKYVKEFEYRYNRRKDPSSIFADLVANL